MYDIRGLYPEQINPQDALLLGKAFGTFFQKNGVKEVFLGRDNRISGPLLGQKISQGLKETGCNVINVGTVITPMIYFTWYKYQAQGTMMITASHNPPEYNGIKSSLKKRVIFGPQLKKVYQIFKGKKFASAPLAGKEKKKNIANDYINDLVKRIHLKKKLSLIVDTGNGTAGLFARTLFEKAGCQVKMLFEESDGRFPNHHPYPQKEEFYQELKNTLRKGKYDLGVAFDGDGDRLGIYTPEGSFVENDILAAIFAREICRRQKNVPIVLNVSATLAVLETIKKHGGQPLLWHTGYPFISQKMEEINSPFGGEISGHFLFRDRYYGFDDAFYATLRLLEIISQGKNIRQLIEEIPQYPSIPEFRLPVPKGKDKYKLVEIITKNVKKHYPKAKISTIDGLRFSFGDRAWGLIRPSNTEPVISGRAEGKTEKELKLVRSIINQELNKVGIKQKI